jgi:hypothetical protein
MCGSRYTGMFAEQLGVGIMGAFIRLGIRVCS